MRDTATRKAKDPSVAGAESIAAFQSNCPNHRHNRFPRLNQIRILKTKRRRSLRRSLRASAAETRSQQFERYDVASSTTSG